MIACHVRCRTSTGGACIRNIKAALPNIDRSGSASLYAVLAIGIALAALGGIFMCITIIIIYKWRKVRVLLTHFHLDVPGQAAALCPVVLPCAALCCAALCWPALCCTVLQSPRGATLFCNALCCATLCYAVLCCTICAVLHHSAMCCAVLCCAVLCCAVLCCAVLCCAVLCCAPDA